MGNFGVALLTLLVEAELVVVIDRKELGPVWSVLCQANIRFEKKGSER